ncbi:MAG TPA: VOC family protein [Acidobacteriaceae bacterium]
MANPFVHLELNTTDLKKAQAFYGGMFGWKFDDMNMGAGIYSTFKPDSGPGGGMYSAPDMPRGWQAYVGVDDIKAATAKAKSLGAEIHTDSQEIPTVGWMTIMSDPTGVRAAMFQPKK